MILTGLRDENKQISRPWPLRKLILGFTNQIHLIDDLRPGDTIFLTDRISTWEQNDDREAAQRKLARRITKLRQEVERRGAQVVGVHTEVVSGVHSDWFSSVARKAKSLGATFILAATVDRLRRSPFYSKQAQRFQADDHDLADLAFFTDDFPLMTFLRPDATPGECRSLLTRWGQEDRPGGRPANNQRRLVDWINRKGGTATPRQVQMGCRWLQAPGKAKAALDELVRAGQGAWWDMPTTANGGRPTRQFRLS